MMVSRLAYASLWTSVIAILGVPRVDQIDLQAAFFQNVLRGHPKPAIATPDFIAPFSQKPDAPSAPSPPSASLCEEYREQIEQGLARGRNGKAIWQELV